MYYADILFEIPTTENKKSWWMYIDEEIIEESKPGEIIKNGELIESGETVDGYQYMIILHFDADNQKYLAYKIIDFDNFELCFEVKTIDELEAKIPELFLSKEEKSLVKKVSSLEFERQRLVLRAIGCDV